MKNSTQCPHCSMPIEFEAGHDQNEQPSRERRNFNDAAVHLQMKPENDGIESSVPEASGRERIDVLLSVALIAIAAILDASRPFGRSWSLSYVIVGCFVASRLRGRVELVLLSTTILVSYLIPMLLHPEPFWTGTGLLNRTRGTIGGLMMIAVVWGRRRVIESLRTAKMELESQVLARTSDLEAANESLRREIAEREKSTASLRASEDRFVLFMRHIPGPVWIKDIQGRYVYANDSTLNAFRKTRSETFGKTGDAIFPAETASQLNSDDQKALTTGEVVRNVESISYEDGTIHHFAISRFPLLAADGQFALVGGIATDISERLNAEETIQRISNFREAIINTAAEGICVFHPLPDFPFVSLSVWNEQMIEITGYTIDEVNRHGWSQLLFRDPKVQELVQQRMRRALAQDDWNGEEWEITRKGGDRHIVAISTSRVAISESANCIVALVQDVTERKKAEIALRKSEARFHLLFEGANDAIFWADADTGLLLNCNRAAEQLLGRERAEIIGQPQTFLHPPDQLDQNQKTFQSHARCEEKSHVETEIQRKDGGRVPVSIAPSVTTIEGQRVIQGIFRDITLRKQADEALRQSQERLKSIFETVAEGLLLVSSEGRIVELNPEAQRFLGYTGEQLRALDPENRPWNVVDENGMPIPLESRPDRMTLRTGQPQRDVVMGIDKPGLQRIWVSVNSAPMLDDQGNVSMVVVSFGDITERKQAEETLQMMRICVDHAGDSVFWVSRSGKILYANNSACKDRGYSRDEMLTMTVFDLDTEPEYQPGAWADHFEELKRRGTITLETRHQTKDGRTFPIEVNANYVQIGDQEFNFAFTRDVSERKRVEEELRRSRQRLEILSRQLIMTQETERRHLARELHDEIGQILTAIKINLSRSQRLADGQLESNLNDIVEIVDKAIIQVRNLALRLRPAQLDELGLVAALHWLLKNQAELGGIKEEFEVNVGNHRIPPELETVCFRITQEALTNAVRHGKPTKVHLKLWATENHLHLSIHDDGIGFDVDASRLRAFEGSSFGLVSIQERASLAEGWTEIESKPGLGTTVHACFPLSKS